MKAGDASGLPELDSTLSPTTLGASCHSSVGFGFGLLLSELFPEKKDELIARGLDYGKSRVIAPGPFLIRCPVPSWPLPP